MSISLLEKLAGKTEEMVADYNGLKIVFRTLSQKEYDEILRINPRADLFGLELTKIPTLARAIVSIDGMKFEGYSEFVEMDSKLSAVQRKEIIIGDMDAISVDALYTLYTTERDKIIKKKTKMTIENQSSVKPK